MPPKPTGRKPKPIEKVKATKASRNKKYYDTSKLKKKPLPSVPLLADNTASTQVESSDNTMNELSASVERSQIGYGHEHFFELGPEPLKDEEDTDLLDMTYGEFCAVQQVVDTRRPHAVCTLCLLRYKKIEPYPGLNHVPHCPTSIDDEHEDDVPVDKTPERSNEDDTLHLVPIHDYSSR